MVDILTGIPSIVAALFIYALWVSTIGLQRVPFAVTLALVILMIPTVVRSTEEMLKLVPNELREASYALGVPKWKTIMKVVLPTAFSGIITGILLGLARVMGETAPLIILGPYTKVIASDLFGGLMATLPTMINNDRGENLAAGRRPGLGRRPHPHPAHLRAQPAGPVHRPLQQGQGLTTGATRRTRTATRPTASEKRQKATDTMAKRIDVKDLDIYYGDFKAVEGVTMTVEPRSVTSFIGPSGCGKSTVLRTLNRMHEVIPGARVEGSVMLDDQDLYASSMDPVAVRRTVGMVFQRPNPFPTMSIRDNVAAGLKLNGMKGKKELDEVVERSLKSANLWNEVKDRLDKPGAGLSGGQQQRLCIARAIAVSPQVLLMDEPCSALDPISTLAIEDLINELKSNYTIVIVTHNMQQAARVSDQTAFFNLKATGEPGRLVEVGDTQRIFSNPTEKATEDYITGRFG